MEGKIKSSEDFWAGLMFIALGAAAMYISRDYPMGTALRMGPGYFPTWLGGIMVFLGGWVFVSSFVVKGEGIGKWAWRPLLVLCGTIALFGALMDRWEVGFVPALLAVVLGSAFAHHDVRWLETLLLMVFLVAGCVALFIYTIGLPYKLFWWQ